MSNIANELLKSAITPISVEKADGSLLTCHMRDLSAGDILDFVTYEVGEVRNEALLQLVAKAIVEEDGTPVFTDKDLKELRDMPVRIFQQLSDAVVRAAGLGEDDDKEGGEKGN